ncbi:MAG TPA: nitrous oxide reductase family maturation protein NosD [Gemmatimonadaceae bacterium]|jgi:nitrous oxidase accessory protein|nr:nitrous oxide reductase family maturation protein NosD [Gemmatimonadaceae bacterium]
MRAVPVFARTALLAACVAAPRPALGQAAHTLVVAPGSALATLGQAVTRASAGDRIVVRAGTYREPMVTVDKRLEIDGDGDAILDGESAHAILTVAADDVTIRHLHFRDVGVSYTSDLAAVRVLAVRNCDIEDNVIERAFFGIYLAKSIGCRVVHNDIRGAARDETSSGNGIHLWSARDALIADNHVSGQRDGIYFEFVNHTVVRGNTSERNLRYGLHFMYSDDCQYLDNTFRYNHAGVAVMYTHRVLMAGNRFESNWGDAAYGLLLKEIDDSRVEDNAFVRNTVGLSADGANRLVASHNSFRSNGWAVRLVSSTDDARFERNNFFDNTFDVGMRGGETTTRFAGNYWDDYRGYDLDRNGVGDAPFHPVRLFSLIVTQNPPTLLLLRSPFVTLLDAVERAMPSLTPSSVVDGTPALQPLR